MTAYRATHRRQAAEGTWAAKYGCTAVSALVAMDQATRGRVGPAISADAFRAAQPDQTEGIDLHDARIAAATFGVALEVRAAYGGTTAATWAELVALGDPASRRALVIQGDHDRLPVSLRCAGFLGDHAVMSSGWRLVAGSRSWDISNPLCPGWVAWPDHVMKAYVEAIAGPNRAFVAAAPPTPEEDMKITAQVRERWHPTVTTLADGTKRSNGVLRETADRAAPLVTNPDGSVLRIPADQTIVTVAEIRTVDGPLGDWRLAETEGRTTHYAWRSDWKPVEFIPEPVQAADCTAEVAAAIAPLEARITELIADRDESERARARLNDERRNAVATLGGTPGANV